MGSDAIRVHKRQSWSSVPDAVLEHPSLSLGARLVLAWMLGRPPGWEIRVGPMCRVLRLTDKTWPRIRDELCAAGFFRQQRLASSAGRVQWRQEVSDEPLYTTPPKRGDGAIPPKGMDGASMDGGGEGIPPSIKQKDIYHHHPADGGGICPGWQEAVDYELEIEEKQRGLRNPAGLRRTILKRYVAAGGPDAAIVAALNARKAEVLRAAANQRARDQSLAAAAQAAAAGSPPPASSQLGRQLARTRALAADKSQSAAS